MLLLRGPPPFSPVATGGCDRRMVVRPAAEHRRPGGVRRHVPLHDGQNHHVQWREASGVGDLGWQGTEGGAPLQLRGFSRPAVMTREGGMPARPLDL